MGQVKMLLRVMGPDGASRELTIDRESVIVGSGESANVRLEDPQVSPIHVMLKWEAGGELHAIDLGSEAGTRVGGQPIADPTALTSGDVVEIGGTKIAVSFETAAAKALKMTKNSGEKGATAAAQDAARRGDTLLGGLRGANAAALFYEELPPEQKPASGDRALDVAMIWGDTIIEANQFQDGEITIGHSDGNAFKVYIENVETHALAKVSGDSATLSAPAGGQILVRKDGKDQKAGSSATIGLEDRARIQLGNVEFVLRFVKPDEPAKTGFLDGIDLYFTKILSIAAMIHIVILAMLMITPTDTDILAEDLFRNNARISQILLHPPEEPERKLLDLSGAEEGEKAADDEGAFGKIEEEQEQADRSKDGSQIVDADRREEDRRRALTSGLLGALGADDGAASNVLGPGGLGAGVNDAIGGITGGAGMGTAHGVGGLGTRGTGSGGGGTGLGIGGLGTQGGGRGRGGSGLDLGGRGRRGTTRIIPGNTTVLGGLSREEIGEVIRKNQNSIKACYDRELQKNPNIQGRIEVSFTIDGTGRVSQARAIEDQVGTDGAVARCVVARVRRLRFPEPRGGGEVMVSYPWIFRHAGSD